jgi:acid stress-induced BolA-like protein IbaG/YrbA
LGKPRALGEVKMKDVIINTLKEGLKYDDLIVEGSDAKYEVKIVSDEFDGKTIIQRHKIIYALLDSYIKTGEIHALSIKATTASESR